MLRIQILGSGCANCHKLEAMCKEVLEEQGIEAAIAPVTDLNRIHARGVMMTPGLVINDQVVSSGRVPSKSSIEQWILKAVQ